MVSPSDFQFLADLISKTCRETLGVTTLKRIWGYVKGYSSIRNSTLSVLCKFVGFKDWQDFLTQYSSGSESSRVILSDALIAESLPENALIQVCWAPNRKCIFRHIFNGNFVVMESENSKLQPNDTFHCSFFIIGQPLYLDNLVHQNEISNVFVVGAKGGLSTVKLL